MTILNNLKLLLENDAGYEYHERYNEILIDIIEGFINSDKDETIPWNPMEPHRLIKIIQDYSKQGIVRDESGLSDIVDFFINKIITIDISTMLLGHTALDPKQILSDEGYDLSEEDIDRLGEYLVDESGQWILSDYGLDKLTKLAIDLLGETSSENKLLLLDRVLNVIHQRSDLSSYFIKGGKQVLDSLFEN